MSAGSDEGSEALDPDRLCERASQLARLDDFGDPNFRVALGRLCASSLAANLTPRGLVLVGGHIVRALVTRLRLVRARREEPARFAQSLNEPVVVLGPARSGTTFLHNLLCATPEVRFIPFWEAREPIPDPDEDNRRAFYAHTIALFDEMVPDSALKHPADVDAPEECVYLLNPSFVSMSFCTYAPVQSYLEWLLEQDQREPYRIYRQLLEYIQASAPDRRLVLKSPAHLGTIAALLGAVPEAKIVQLHRDPLAVLPSLCSLFETLYQSTVAEIPRDWLGRYAVALLDHQLRGNAEQRMHIDPCVVFDLQFDKLTSDPIGSVHSIHDSFDWSWSEEVGDKLRALIDSRAAEVVQHGRYRLADFGLIDAEVAERFRDYRERWGFA